MCCISILDLETVRHLAKAEFNNSTGENDLTDCARGADRKYVKLNGPLTLTGIMKGSKLWKHHSGRTV